MPPRRMTSIDVAKLAGVSQSTVSRVINNKPGASISDETRARVLEAARQLNYHPSAAARSLVRRRTGIIGLVVSEPSDRMRVNAFSPSVIAGITSVAGKANFKLLVQPMEDLARPDIPLNLVREADVDGIILSEGRPLFGLEFRPEWVGGLLEDRAFLQARENFRQLVEMYANSGPLVLWGQLPGSDIPFVDVDNFKAARTAVEHLIALGHRRIACITPGPPIEVPSAERLRGYRAALEAHNIPFEEAAVRYAKYDESSGSEAILSLLQMPERPSAVFVASDEVAFGVLHAARSAGLSLPEDLAIVGFDDLPASNYITPSLTSVHVPAHEVGVVATQMLIEMIQTDNRPASRLLETNLVIRESSGAPIKSL